LSKTNTATDKRDEQQLAPFKPFQDFTGSRANKVSKHPRPKACSTAKENR
jgi:hypothetical protein